MDYPSAREIVERLLSEYHGVKTRRKHRIVLLSSDDIREFAGRKQLRGRLLSSVQGMFERREMYLFRSKDTYLMVPFGAPTSLSAKSAKPHGAAKKRRVGS